MRVILPRYGSHSSVSTESSGKRCLQSGDIQPEVQIRYNFRSLRSGHFREVLHAMNVLTSTSVFKPQVVQNNLTSAIMSAAIHCATQIRWRCILTVKPFTRSTTMFAESLTFLKSSCFSGNRIYLLHSLHP